MQAPGKTTELLILPVTEGQYGVTQVRQGQLATQQAALKTTGAVRRLAVTEGADHKQRAAGLAQRLGIHPRQRLHLHRDAGGLQLPGCAPGQLFRQAALAGKTHQPMLALS